MESGKRERRRKGDRAKKHSRMLRVVLINLFVAFMNRSSTYVRLSKDKNNYRPDTRYKSIHLSRRYIHDILVCLKELGYIEYHPGGYNKTLKVGVQTRIRATQKLIDRFDMSKLKPSCIGQSNDMEVILLRDEKKYKTKRTEGGLKRYKVQGELINYEDTVETCVMRAGVRKINYFNNLNTINLHISDAEEASLAKSVSYFNTYLHRSFNNGSFEQGGRFYGAWWQSIPSQYREYVTINGWNVVELDFSTMHPKMLYSEIGIDYNDDAYDLDGCPEDSRDVIKEVFNAMLNTSHHEFANPDAFELELLPDGKTLEDLQHDILLKHEKIKHLFYTGIGLKFQYIDSQVAERVMLRAIECLQFASRFSLNGTECTPKICILPVHDSFIIAAETESDRDVLKRIMAEEFKAVVGVDIGIKKTVCKDADKVTSHSSYKAYEEDFVKTSKKPIEAFEIDEQGYIKECRAKYLKEYAGYLARERYFKSGIKQYHVIENKTDKYVFSRMDRDGLLKKEMMEEVIELVKE